jgi:hypothetical protein
VTDMKLSEFNNTLINSLDADNHSAEISGILEKAVDSYDFSLSFKDKVLQRLIFTGRSEYREREFVKSLNFVLYRLALPGVAAVVLLMISIFLMEGSFSFDSFFGLSDNYNEGIVCLLTGK